MGSFVTAYNDWIEGAGGAIAIGVATSCCSATLLEVEDQKVVLNIILAQRRGKNHVGCWVLSVLRYNAE